jgi:hypothetical protein
MKIFFAFVLLSFFSFNGIAQNLTITGQLISTGDSIPIESASISILKKNEIVSNTVSDKNGQFQINDLLVGDYSLKVTHILYDSLSMSISNISKSVDFGKIELYPKSNVLEEIFITGSSSIVKIDRQLFFPSREDVRKSSNGIDLIENLGINGLTIQKNNNSIIGKRGGVIPIRINGAPADPKELQAIDPKNVIRLEYHDFPSLRYGNAEGVIDIIVRNREDGGQIVWNSRNSFIIPWGDIYFTSKFNRGRSQWGISAAYTLHSYKETYRSQKDIYVYEDGRKITRELQGIPSKFKEYYTDITASYSYSIPDDLLFSAKVIYSMWNESPNTTRGNVIEKNIINIREINLTDEQTHKEDKPSFDLYLQKKLPHSQLIAINVVGSYFNIKRTQDLFEEDEEIINSIVDGRKYSIIGDVYYEKTFSKGKFSTGITHTYGHSDNDYSGSTTYQSNLKTNNTYAYLEWNGKMKELTYGLGAGFTFNSQKQENYETRNNTYINPTIRMSYPVGKNTQLRYQGRVSISNPDLGETNAVEIPLDSYLWWRGNPNLKPFINYMNALSLNQTIKKMRINFDIYDSYTPKGIMNNYFDEGGKLITQQINGDVIHRLYFTGGVNVRLMKDRLSLGTSIGFRWMQSKSDFFNHIERYWTISGNASYRINKITLWVNISPKAHNLTGESLYKSSQLISTGADYRHKEFTVGLGYMTYDSKYSYESAKLSKHYQNNIWYYNPDFRNLVYLRFSWNFNFGKSYKTQDRIQYQEDSDSGVTKQGNK